MVVYVDVLDSTQISMSCFKVEGLPKRFETDPKKLESHFRKNLLDQGAEPPRNGFIGAILADGRTFTMEYLIELPERLNVVSLVDGDITSEYRTTFSVKMIAARLWLESGLLTIFSNDKRVTGHFLKDFAAMLGGSATVEKITLSDDFLENFIKLSDDLVRVKLDRLQDTYLKDITLRGDTLALSQDYMEFREDKSGLLSDVQIRYTTAYGKTLTLIINRDGSFRMYRGKAELDWDDINEILGEVEGFI